MSHRRQAYANSKVQLFIWHFIIHKDNPYLRGKYNDLGKGVWMGRCWNRSREEKVTVTQVGFCFNICFHCCVKQCQRLYWSLGRQHQRVNIVTQFQWIQWHFYEQNILKLWDIATYLRLWYLSCQYFKNCIYLKVAFSTSVNRCLSDFKLHKTLKEEDPKTNHHEKKMSWLGIMFWLSWFWRLNDSWETGMDEVWKKQKSYWR